MEIRQIAYVLEIAKHKSFSKAAKALFISQPAISHQIHALEEELQVKLFKRDTHTVNLTDDGVRFCLKAQPIIDSIDDLMREFHQNVSSQKRILTIGIFPFYHITPLKRIINDFFITHHNVIGSIQVMDNYEAESKLMNGEINFAIIKSMLKNLSPDYQAEILFEENLNALIRRDKTDPTKGYLNVQDLGNYPILTGEKNSHFYNEMKMLCQENGTDFNVAFMNTLHTDTIIDMVRSGFGIELVTDQVAKHYIDNDITALTIKPYRKIHTILAYRKNIKLSGSDLAFVNYIIDEISKYDSPIPLRQD